MSISAALSFLHHWVLEGGDTLGSRAVILNQNNPCEVRLNAFCDYALLASVLYKEGTKGYQMAYIELAELLGMPTQCTPLVERTSLEKAQATWYAHHKGKTPRIQFSDTASLMPQEVVYAALLILERAAENDPKGSKRR